MNRRDFLKALSCAAVVPFVPKPFFDMGAAWQRREASGLFTVVPCVATITAMIRSGFTTAYIELLDENGQELSVVSGALDFILIPGTSTRVELPSVPPGQYYLIHHSTLVTRGSAPSPEIYEGIKA